jgi:rhodanese-related sulfurtransferase/DNA-binding transcriptional ArsR family regulator|tara:strand:+ start:5597 stop:6253 length:657 start_codon:yes stop_codon:yes gene_type:complete
VTDVSPKQAIFEHVAAFARALGAPARLDLLEHLAQGEASVETLATRTMLSIANTSQHLQTLRRSGLVKTRRDGRHILYALSDDAIVGLVDTLSDVAERHVAEIDRVRRDWFDARDMMEPVTREDLIARMKDGLVTVLDVRPADEASIARLPGAVNIPLAELETRLGELAPDREIVAYCRGPWCVLAFEAVSKLREKGFRARRLEGGLPQWRAAGLPMS